MRRRSFVKNSTLSAFSIAGFGALHCNGKNFEGDSITTTDILGPYYLPGSPMHSNLIPKDSTGQILHLNGTIFVSDGRTPMVNALIESWQCDEKEHYDNLSDEYRFRGCLKTGKDGKIAFKTMIPVPYKDGEGWRPSHIHLRISSHDHQDLITQIYFKRDPHIEKDKAANAPQSVNRILEIKKNPSNESVVKFNIVLGKPFLLNTDGYKKITGIYQLKNGTAEFNRQDDILFLKMNGQYMEGMVNKGNNSFEGGFGANKVRFELLPNGEVICKIKLWDFPKDQTYLELHESIKILKYSE